MVDLQAQRRRLEPGLGEAMARVLAHGRFVLGPEVEELELRLGDLTGASCVTCGNGTDALELALWAEAIGAGDAVVLPAFTFAATAEAVVRRGATPVFADVDDVTWNLDPASARRALEWAGRSGLRTRALIAVDLFGWPADYPRLAALAEEREVTLIADAAQSLGAALGNRPVGALAPLTATSFYPSKPLGCYGDGGAIFALDPAKTERLRLLARHGQGPGRYNHLSLGANSRLDTLQAAILLAKLAVFEPELAERDAVARRYDAGLAGIVELPARPAGALPAWAQYTIRHPERDRLAKALSEAGIATAVHYPKPVNLHPPYRSYPAPDGVPVSRRLADSVL
ncbi:MAG TPA: DegT/DnrJ/EryC1/StrS family aminotransferase, partial [Kiloniellales bacterium]|nr:DegT/DnrJ/EryC1/StrS family aminotransferase [Kiloniellales bacterium]